MSKRRSPNKSDLRRRRRMRWFLGSFLALALLTAVLRAIMLQQQRGQVIHARQALPTEPVR